MKARWKSAHAFAEYAEALQVETRAILGVAARDGDVTVFYAPAEPETLVSVKLRRDPHGILRVVGTAREEVGLWEQLKDSLR